MRNREWISSRRRRLDADNVKSVEGVDQDQPVFFDLGVVDFREGNLRIKKKNTKIRDFIDVIQRRTTLGVILIF
jgi:hypothetical protein